MKETKVVDMPKKAEQVSEELIQLHEEAEYYGLAVGEWKLGEGFLAAVIPWAELDTLGITNLNELGGSEFLLGHTWPGSGETRELAIKGALKSHQEHMGIVDLDSKRKKD